MRDASKTKHGDTEVEAGGGRGVRSDGEGDVRGASRPWLSTARAVGQKWKKKGRRGVKAAESKRQEKREL